MEHVDVLIVGAGLSGIGAAVHLQENCPDKTYAILEGRSAIGGTWDLFRYPGIRSDSDMYTLGYSFKPWPHAKSIADGPAILSYVEETSRDYGVDPHIRFDHKVLGASWSTADARWTVDAEHDGSIVQLTCTFLFGCTGYYRYDEGYTPDFPGVDTFKGTVVHPQHWPEDLDYAGKKVVVIGSGATAVTLVPAMAKEASHVTMLQRSPTYIIAMPGEDPIAKGLRKVLPSKLHYSVVRWKNVLSTMASFELSRRRPAVMKKLLRAGVQRALPKGYAVDTHFKPDYNPWDQRLCLIPDGDLFRSIRHGDAEIVTDHIEAFDETGIMLRSGEHLDADVIVTATGLNLLAFGGLDLTVDGAEVNLPDHLGYKGMMLSDVPNFAFSIGYTNASWTLKCDLTCEYVCRLLNHMDSVGADYCVAPRDESVEEIPLIDFSSGYVQRSIDQFPRQGSKTPWRVYQNYIRDTVDMKRGSVDDGAMRFEKAPSRARVPA